jgi:hypothetical protein
LTLVLGINQNRFIKNEPILIQQKDSFFADTGMTYILPITAFTDEKSKLEFLEFINSKVDIVVMQNKNNAKQ